MILHASLAADNPRHVAETLARLLGGEAFPLPGLTGNGWLAIGGEDERTLVEVLPRGTEFTYLPGEHVALRAGEQMRHGAFHIMLETRHEEDAVLAIAGEQDCRAHRARHGLFDVIEFWVEGSTLVEVMTPPLAAAYRSLITLDNVRAALGNRASNRSAA